MLECDNPLGLNGFAFVEFTSPDIDTMTGQLKQLGFVAAARQEARNLTLFRQGNIAIVLNPGSGRQAAEFRDLHGPSANGMAFRVTDAAKAHG